MALRRVGRAALAKPAVSPGESEQDYMGRCIPFMLREGKEQDAAVAQCAMMYRQAKGLQKLNLSLEKLTSVEEEPDENLKLDLFAKNVETGSSALPEDLDLGSVVIVKGTEVHYSLGIVLAPETLDLTRTEKSVGDIYSEEEIFKAMTDFNLTRWNRGQDVMHSGNNNLKLVIVESYQAPVDFTIGGQAVKKGTWLLKTLYLDEQAWEGVRTGKFTGLSIEGRSRVKFEAA